ncbi:hypothetical protein EH221_02685 [bacterium]|nr:MAG: hypothetical protein EH221_02685 [bacterium]
MHPEIDKKYLGALEEIVFAMETKQVPLVIINKDDQLNFLEQISQLLGGSVIDSAMVNVLKYILSSIKEFDYLFLLIKEHLDRIVIDFIRFYLDSTNIFQSGDKPVSQKFKDYTIHDEHRLILLIDWQMFQSLPKTLQDYFSGMCCVIFIST